MFAREDLPEAVARLLWDVDFAQFDLDKDRQLVFERVMSRGTWEAMKWLRLRYSRDDIVAFLRDYGRRVLSPRDLAYWALVCEVEVSGNHDGGGGRPRWAGA